MTKREAPKKAAKKDEPTRLRSFLEGLAILGGAIVGGLAVLGIIGLIPDHQEYPPLQPVLMVVSLAMIVGVLWGGWLVIKALWGWSWLTVRRLLGGK
jgi:hypothetical protein